MPRSSTAYEVLIASPSDVMAERQVVADVIGDWNSAHARTSGMMLQARRWELDAVPAVGDRPQAIINKQLVDEADILIAVFSARLGTSTGMAESGTAEEIERFRSKNKPVLLYFSKAAVPRDHEPEQLQRLKEYKRQLASDALYFEFSDDADLFRMVSRHLASAVDGMRPEPAINVDTEELASELAKKLQNTQQVGVLDAPPRLGMRVVPLSDPLLLQGATGGTSQDVEFRFRLLSGRPVTSLSVEPVYSRGGIFSICFGTLS